MAEGLECYRKGIQIDKLFEDFYVRMMLCHERLGRRAEAVGTGQTKKFMNLDELGIALGRKMKPEKQHVTEGGKR